MLSSTIYGINYGKWKTLINYFPVILDEERTDDALFVCMMLKILVEFDKLLIKICQIYQFFHCQKFTLYIINVH